MNSGVLIQYPWWFLGFCLLLGVVFAILLYARDKTFEDQPKWLRRIFAFIRGFAIAAISFLLLSPLLRNQINEVKKPVLVIAQDVSESIGFGLTKSDSASYFDGLNKMIQNFEEDFDVQTYNFGSDIESGINSKLGGKSTNISKVLQRVYDDYVNQNLGGVILASDGIYNEGANPIYTGAKINAPVYTIALGDTTPRRDLSIKRVFHNKIAYLGDRFSIQVDIGAFRCAGSNSKLTVHKIDNGGSNKVYEQPIRIRSNDYFETKEIILEANAAGVQRYRIGISPLSGEISKRNNYRDLFIDVLDARQKILILAGRPHPDLGTIKTILNTNKNYDAQIHYVSKPPPSFSSYDLLILHQIPTTGGLGTLSASSLLKARKPLLFFLGDQTDFVALTQFQNLIKISGAGQNFNNSNAALQGSFSLFKISPEIGGKIQNFPPLQTPFGTYSTDPAAEELLRQKIGKVNTEFPLWVIGNEDGIRKGIICGEGLWRWRLFDQAENGNLAVTEEILNKTVQYLTIKEDKRKFRVYANKNVFKENESLYFDAELYNESYELINEPDANLIIKSADGRDYQYTFSRTENAYALDAGLLPVGNYTYTGKTFAQGKELKHSGKISIQPVQLEAFERTANHKVLRQLSNQFGGQMFYPNQLNQIPASLTSQGRSKPVLYSKLKTRPLIDLKWLFFPLLLLLVLEWFLRRYYGGY